MFSVEAIKLKEGVRMNTSKTKPMTIALGAAFLASALSPVASAEANPFSVQTLPSGYDIVNAGSHEGKCGEGKCGGKESKSKEGRCGEGKCGGDDAKGKEGKCGEGKCGGEGKGKKEGKCGEGKCGGKEGKRAEGKCGEGKCGG